jgi:hypothetical protein
MPPALTRINVGAGSGDRADHLGIYGRICADGLGCVVYLAFARLLASLVLVARTEASNDTEILVLRQQLAVLQRTTRPPRMSCADRRWSSRSPGCCPTSGA